MEPTRLLPIISVLLLVTVECGGYALLGLLTGQKLSEFQQTFFSRRGCPCRRAPRAVTRLLHLPKSDGQLSGWPVSFCSWGSWPSRAGSSSIWSLGSRVKGQPEPF
jgi:hypothetical protein